MCCHADQASQSQGQCVGKGGLCTDADMLCDDASDCSGGNVCCAEIDPGGEIKGDIQCKPSCITAGGGSVEILCNPIATSPCPGGLSCKPALKMTGYSSCQP